MLHKHLRNVAVRLLALLSLFPVTAWGQDDTATTEDEIFYPLAVVNLASVDQLLGHADYLFASVDRPEISDLIGAGLARFQDLDGLDKSKPAGLMIFLSEGLIPIPNPVAYIPVADMTKFSLTLESAGALIKKDPDFDDLYELTPPTGPSQFVALRNGYAFIGQSYDTVNRNFADPVTFGGALGKRYDICVSADLRHTPKHVRDLLVGTIRNSAGAGMQRRDDEPEAAFRVRRAQAEGNLHFIENLLKEGEEFTVGLKVDREKNNAFLEVVIRAKPDTPFAEELLEGSGQPSYFATALDDTVPLSFSMSAMLNKYNRKTLTELFSVGSIEANRGLAGLSQETPGEEVPELESVRSATESLKRTISQGHLDGFVQFFNNDQQKFVLVGGVKLVDATEFGAGLTDILTRAKQSASDTQIELSVAGHGDVVFHRITGANASRGDQNMYGGVPSLYVGTDQQALWFAVGGDAALPTVKAAIDRVAAGGANVRKDDLPPFEFVMNMNHWIRLNQGNNETTAAVDATAEPVPGTPRRPGGRGQFRAITAEAFAGAGSDILRVDARQIENGFRIRAQVENGFLRFVAIAIASRIERRQAL